MKELLVECFGHLTSMEKVRVMFHMEHVVPENHPDDMEGYAERFVVFLSCAQGRDHLLVARLMLGFDRKQAAERYGVSASGICMMEKGTRPPMAAYTDALREDLHAVFLSDPVPDEVDS